MDAPDRRARRLCPLHEEGHDDRDEGYELRDHSQTEKKFPYHDGSNVTLSTLQFNGVSSVAVCLRHATLQLSRPECCPDSRETFVGVQD